jgi:hypothetical protein
MFGDPYLVWHDGPDFARLRSLAGDGPAEVARMLAVGIREGDPLAAQSIAALAAEGMAPAGSVELLAAAAATGAGSFLVCVAQALHALTGEESWAEPIVSVLLSDAFWGVRIDAAMALAGFAPAPWLIRAVGEGVRADDYLVRYHCANTLLRYAGSTRQVSDIADLFGDIVDQDDDHPTEDDLARHRRAADRLTAGALRKQP